MICLDYVKIWQVGFISILFFADILCTYFFIVKYRQKFPKDKEWYNFEFNFILRNFWRKYGIHLGTLISIVIIYPLFFLVIYWINERFILGMIVGLYIMIFVMHLLNFRIFKENKNGKEEDY